MRFGDQYPTKRDSILNSNIFATWRHIQNSLAVNRMFNIEKSVPPEIEYKIFAITELDTKKVASTKKNSDILTEEKGHMKDAKLLI